MDTSPRRSNHICTAHATWIPLRVGVIISVQRMLHGYLSAREPIYTGTKNTQCEVNKKLNKLVGYDEYVGGL